MVGLGLLSGFAGSLGVSLVLLLIFHVVAGRVDDASGFLGRVYDIVGTLTGGSTVGLALAAAGLVVGTSLLNGAYAYLEGAVRHRIHHEARVRVFRRYLTAPYEDIAQKDFGEMLNTLQVETWYVSEAVHQAARIAINISTILVFSLVIAATSWPMALATAASGLVFMTIIRSAHQRLRGIGERTTELKEGLSDQTITTVQALRTIRLFGAEQAQTSRYVAQSDAVRRMFLSLSRVQVTVRPIAEITSLALTGALVWLSIAIGNSVATTLTVIALVYKLQPNIREIEHNVMSLSGMLGSLRRVVEAMQGGEPTDRVQGKPFAGLSHAVELRSVGFLYRGSSRPAVQDVDLTLSKGSLTALVGPSGAGKTTLVNLLLGLYRPNSGSVIVDGVPVDEFDRSQWLSKVAVSGQDVELLEGTILDNIRLAKPDCSVHDAERALRLAGIYDLIVELPKGMDSRVGDRGLRLSGGQRQRIALARALAARPDLLVLDEATNAIDSALERKILAAIRREHPDMTILLIAHRGSATAEADQVAVIEGGRLVDVGSPSELRSRPESLFNALFEAAPPAGTL